MPLPAEGLPGLSQPLDLANAPTRQSAVIREWLIYIVINRCSQRVQALTGPYARVWHQVPAWAGSGIPPHSTPQDVLRIALETSRGEIQWNCFPAQI